MKYASVALTAASLASLASAYTFTVPISYDDSIVLAYNFKNDPNGVVNQLNEGLSITLPSVADGDDAGACDVLKQAMVFYNADNKGEVWLTWDEFFIYTVIDPSTNQPIVFTSKNVQQCPVSSTTTTVAPVDPTTTAAPVDETTTTAAPAEPTTTAAPVDETTTAAPAEPTTTAAPVDETTTAAPVDETTTSAAPVDETTTAAPVDETTTAAPVDETTTDAPVEPTTTAAPADSTTSSAAPITTTDANGNTVVVAPVDCITTTNANGETTVITPTGVYTTTDANGETVVYQAVESTAPASTSVQYGYSTVVTTVNNVVTSYTTYCPISTIVKPQETPEQSTTTHPATLPATVVEGETTTKPAVQPENTPAVKPTTPAVKPTTPAVQPENTPAVQPATQSSVTVFTGAANHNVAGVVGFVGLAAALLL